MVNFEQLSPYSQALLKKLDADKSSLNEPKLIASLSDRDLYTVHWKYLKTALSCGLKVENVYRIIKFKQDAFCAKYINICVNARKNATNIFERELYKLCQNALFGKMIENVRDRTKIKFIT